MPVAKQGKNITYGGRNMTSLWSPFSYVNSEPKYPDGKAQYSIGIKNVDDKEVEGQELLVVLYPGLNSYMLCYDNQNTPVNPLLKLVQAYFSHDSVTYYKVQGSPTNELVQDDMYSGWRPVSTAVKIKHLSETQRYCEANDGWWEAVRSNRAIDPEDWRIMSTRTGPDVNWKSFEGGIVPNVAFMDELFSGQNWSINPSYSTGKFNDLGRQTFQLNQIRTDNDIIDVRNIDSTNISQTAVAGLEPDSHGVYGVVTEEFPVDNEPPVKNYTYLEHMSAKVLPLQDGTGLANPSNHMQHREQGFDHLFSSAFDMIIIKLHGKQDSRFLVQGVSNQEFLAIDSKAKIYATASYPALDELREYLRIRNADYKIPNHNYY